MIGFNLQDSNQHQERGHTGTLQANRGALVLKINLMLTFPGSPVDSAPQKITFESLKSCVATLVACSLRTTKECPG